jgi:hypothetical protein
VKTSEKQHTLVASLAYPRSAERMTAVKSPLVVLEANKFKLNIFNRDATVAQVAA